MSEVRKFYLFNISLFSLSTVWIAWNLFNVGQAKSGFQICILKNTLDIACPSCGTTRSVLHLVHGNLLAAFFTNPIGIIVAAALFIFPFWFLYDFSFTKKTMWVTYVKVIQQLENRKLSFFLLVLVLLNWFWNIQKGV